MRRCLRTAEVGGVAGTVLGAAWGSLHWSSAWPFLSLTNVAVTASEGWLFGMVISLVVVGLRPLRPPVAGQAARRGSRGAGIAWAIVGFSPALLWPVIGLSHGLGAVGGRAIGDNRPNLVLS